jgi:UDP-N-acetylmuramate: L-alanyl-gamma-D-glutamyl-meso-diaminopimelate ligase
LWSELEQTSPENSSCDWCVRPVNADGSHFEVLHQGELVGRVNWSESGEHNLNNALAAIAAARHVGVTPELACQALCEYRGVKRRMELLGEPGGITVYDDFAHHPTAIATTLAGLRAKVGQQRIIAVIEPRSNTMRLGSHLDRLADATAQADHVIWYQPEGLDWSLDTVVASSAGRAQVQQSIPQIIESLLQTAVAGDHIVIMSNGGFAGIHQQLVTALAAK